MAQYNHTRVASYQERIESWQAALDAANKHIKIGQALQSQGLDILRTNQRRDTESAVKLIQQATNTIERGIKIEKDSRDNIIELYQHKPREK